MKDPIILNYSWLPSCFSCRAHFSDTSWRSVAHKFINACLITIIQSTNKWTKHADTGNKRLSSADDLISPRCHCRAGAGGAGSTPQCRRWKRKKPAIRVSHCCDRIRCAEGPVQSHDHPPVQFPPELCHRTEITQAALAAEPLSGADEIHAGLLSTY